MKSTTVGLKQVPRISEHLRKIARPQSAKEIAKAVGVHPKHVIRVLKKHLPEDIVRVPAGIPGYDTRTALWTHADHIGLLPIPRKNYTFKLLKSLGRPGTMDLIYRQVAYDPLVKNELMRFVDEGVAEVSEGSAGRRGAVYRLTKFGSALAKGQGKSKYLTREVLKLLTPDAASGISQSDRAAVNSLISLAYAGREYRALKERGAPPGEVKKLSEKYGMDPKVLTRRVTFRQSPLGHLTKEGAEYRLWLVRERDPGAERWIRDAMRSADIKLKPAKGQMGRIHKNKLARRKEEWVRRTYTQKIPELRMRGVDARTSIVNQLSAYLREVEGDAHMAAEPRDAEHMRFVAGVLRKMLAEQQHGLR